MYRCEICGTKMNELELDFDGMIQCSECGADHKMVNQRLIALHAGPSEE